MDNFKVSVESKRALGSLVGQRFKVFDVQESMKMMTMELNSQTRIENPNIIADIWLVIVLLQFLHPNFYFSEKLLTQLKMS